MGNRQEVIAGMMENTIGLDDTFEFGCKQCGECCHGADIILSGYDIFRIAKYLGKEMLDIVKESCTTHIGDSSHIPIMMLKQRTFDNSCTFLRRGRCQIHPVKPISCALFPLGRYRDVSGNETKYFTQTVHCGTKEKQTPREWLSEFNVQESDEMAKAWFSAVEEVSRHMHKHDMGYARKHANQIASVLYVAYDTNKDYAEQLEENMQELAALIPGLRAK